MKKERAKEVAELEAEKVDAEIQKDKAVKEAESASKKAAQAKKELQEIAPLINNVKSYARDYGRDADRLLPEAGKIETGKGYREKKALPFVEKMKDILFSLYLEYCRLQDKYQRLTRDYNDMWNRRDRLQNRCNYLEERIEEMIKECKHSNIPVFIALPYITRNRAKQDLLQNIDFFNNVSC